MCPPFVRSRAARVASGRITSATIADTVVTTTFLDKHTQRDVDLLWQVIRSVIPAVRSSMVARRNHPKTLNIVLLLTPMLKAFPSSDEAWMPENVNSGVSLISMDGGTESDIMVYRREEFVKVTIHELLHCFGADAHAGIYLRQNPHITDHISRQAHVDSSGLCLGEAYVEAYAVMIYSMCAAHALKKSAEKLLAQQEARAVRVMTDVWRQCQGANKPLIERTPVFAYYFAKTALLMSAGRALRQCPLHGIADDADAAQFARALMLALGSTQFGSVFSGSGAPKRPSKAKQQTMIESAAMTVMHLGEFPGPLIHI